MNKDVTEFFRDVLFEPPNGRDIGEFVGGLEGDQAPIQAQQGDDEEEFFNAAQETVDPSTGTLIKPEDADIRDQIEVSGADPRVWSDFYMFHDPLQKQMNQGLDPLQGPPSQMANTQNKDYHKKNLADIQSAADSHFENLDAVPAPYPRQVSYRSVADRGAFDLLSSSQDAVEPSAQTVDQIAGLSQITDTVLNRPTMIEGKVYPKGTIIHEKVE
jgi:hypothetical protein